MRTSYPAFFWRSNPEWYRVTPDGRFEMTENAPEEAVKSLEAWKKALGLDDRPKNKENDSNREI